MSKLIFASVISEIQQSDVFMTVKARICEAPQANLNGARVTERFIDDIVSNEARYVGLPLYADKKALIGGNYTRLGHLYDEKTGEFHSTQIGSFYKFEKQTEGENCYLVGYARIPKRNRKLSKAISELFSDGKLKFSFELTVGEYSELDDDTILIDASENNYLEGTAIVTYPACEEAVALELVAQKADETGKGENEMAKVENMAEVVETEASQPVTAEEEKKVEETSETAEEAKVEETAEKTEEVDETAACKEKKEKAEEETAAVVTREFHDESHTQVAYDTETGKEYRQTVTISTESSNVQEGTLVETTDGAHVAEVTAEADGDPDPGTGGETPGETPAETQTEEPGSGNEQTETPAGEQTGDNGQTEGQSDEGNGEGETAVNDATPDSYDSKKKQTAEEMIAELAEEIKSLKAEIAEMKATKVVAEKEVVAEVNPFMSTLNTEGKYSLLQKETKTTSYSLLSK